MNRIILLAVALLFLNACSSDGDERPAYLDSQSLKALEIPPQLTRPNNTEELQIPVPSAKALATLQNSGDVEGTVAPKFKGLTLKSDQDIYWLEIEQDADSLWIVLRDFWAHEGIEIERDEPLLGLMETEWIKEYEVKSDRDAGFFKRLLSRLSPDMMDRFRMRIERTGKSARIFVSHRGMHIAVTGESSRWSQRESDAALEKEILYRLTLFAGITEQKADELFLAYAPYQSRLRAVAGSENSFEITGRPELVWKRLQQAVGRLGATVGDSQPAQGLMVIELSAIPQALLVKEESGVDHSEFEPAYERLSTDARPAKAKESDVATKLKLALQAKDSNTVLSVTDENGKPVTDGFAYDAMQTLARLMK